VKLSTRSRYGTRALLDLALNDSGKRVQLKDIAHRQDISLHYLEHIIAPLVGAGIVKSWRGVGGGLKLGRKTEEITLGDVVGLLEGSLSPVQCLGSPDVCNRIAGCATRDIWDELGQIITGFLDSITLEDLVKRQRVKDTSTKVMYHI
jgi:Rrf2 family protein